MSVVISHRDYVTALANVKCLADEGRFDEARRAAAPSKGPSIIEDNMGDAYISCAYDDISEADAYIDGAFYRREIRPLIVGEEFGKASSLFNKISSGELRNQYLSELIDTIVNPNHRSAAISEIHQNDTLYQKLKNYAEEENSYIQRHQLTPQSELSVKVTRLKELLKISHTLTKIE